MNKQKFTQIVQNPHGISADDRNKLQELVSNYPYSQIIHTLIAKGNMDANTDIAKQTLGYAALYATDRGLLKEIIKERKVQQLEPTTEETTTVAENQPIAEPEEKENTKLTVDPNLMKEGEVHLRDQILDDLLALKESKASYMEWLNLSEDYEAEQVSVEKSAKTKVKKTATKTKTTDKGKKKKEAKSSPTEKKSAKAAKKNTAKKETKPVTKKETKAKSSAKSKKTPAKKTESKTKSKSDKKEGDQSEIIDKFISKEPSITAKASRKSPTNQEDLSEPSTEFTEDLISENLAKIMITQGKADKAIDIYKKLIWKFPQKKAYFATQIEELKK